MSARVKQRFIEISFLATALSLPSVLGYKSGFAPLDKPIEIISGLFNIPSLNNEAVQLGLVRFGVWLLVFATANYVFSSFVFTQKGGKKTAGVIAAAIAFIGAFLAPRSVIIMEGSLIAGVVIFMIIGGLLVGGTLVIHWLSNRKEILFRVLSVILVLLLIGIVTKFEQINGFWEPTLFFLSSRWWREEI